MRADYSLRQFLLNALRAVVELARARIELRAIKPRAVLERNERVARDIARRATRPLPAEVAGQCDVAAFFINRMAARVPWRSDCLAQALAGQCWLARAGIASTIHFGTAIAESGEFESHAWLTCDERVVLGGDISRFQPLLHLDAALFDRF